MRRDKEFNAIVEHFSKCCQFKIDNPSSKVPSKLIEKLVELRNKKFSWVDRTENEVRNAVDLFLRSNKI
jgi:hypothetical protein